MNQKGHKIARKTIWEIRHVEWTMKLVDILIGHGKVLINIHMLYETNGFKFHVSVSSRG